MRSDKVSTLPSDSVRQRSQLGIAVILFMALLAAGTLLNFLGFPEHTGQPDVAVLNAKRFEGLLSVLPRRGTVGYVSDTGALEDYYVAQYSLAPLVIAPDAKRELVVANCSSQAAISGMATAHALVVVRDFGNGTALLQRVQ